MSIVTLILAILGLSLFETVSSIDNAVINAEVLSELPPKARRWFLFWGFLFAVVVVRGLLPWLIVWIAAPGLGPINSLTASFSSSPIVTQAISAARPLLFGAAGVFLIFLFCHWLFLEPKNFGLPGEKFILKNGVWFYAVVSIFLAILVHYALSTGSALAFALVLGATAFFITHGFKQNAEQNEKARTDASKTIISKLFYLEIIDTAFSIDSVLGAFAFTLSVPLILIGNGLGAYIVRRLTVGNIEKIKQYRFLKNGAMYSVLFLGIIMLFGAFGYDVPEWVSPIITFVTVGYFYLKSTN